MAKKKGARGGGLAAVPVVQLQAELMRRERRIKGLVKRYERMPVAGRPGAGVWGYVGNVFVLAEHRNVGVGQVLMDSLIAWAGAH